MFGVKNGSTALDVADMVPSPIFMTYSCFSSALVFLLSVNLDGVDLGRAQGRELPQLLVGPGGLVRARAHDSASDDLREAGHRVVGGGFLHLRHHLRELVLVQLLAARRGGARLLAGDAGCIQAAEQLLVPLLVVVEGLGLVRVLFIYRNRPFCEQVHASNCTLSLSIGRRARNY